MNSRLFLALCVALFGLFASQALAADYCLGVPFNLKEKYCGGPIPCPFGQYCDATSTCVPGKALGAACTSNQECAFGSFCRGPENAMVCVAISGVGQPCTDDSSVAQADCYGRLSCNMTSLKCYGGYFGDACSSNSDCLSELCTGGTCDGPVGVPCSSSNTRKICSPSNYCKYDSNDFSRKCAPRVAVGGDCSDNCVPTAICRRTALGSDNYTCVAKASVAAGGFCDDESAVCASGICYNNYCLAKPPTYCTLDGSQCPTGQVCLCGKDFLMTGYGKCSSYKCFDKLMEMQTCFDDQCAGASFESLSYSNSCANLKCKAQYDAAVACNDVLFNTIIAGGGGGGGPTL